MFVISKPIADRKEMRIASTIVRTGTEVEIKPVPSPEMITVAGPVFALLAILIVGLCDEDVKYSVPWPIIIPASNPVITENESPIQLLKFSRYRIIKVEMAMKTALTLTPLFRESISCLRFASSFVLTIKIPSIERNTPTDAIIIGAKTAFCCISGFKTKADAPSAAVDKMDPQNDS